MTCSFTYSIPRVHAVNGEIIRNNAFSFYELDLIKLLKGTCTTRFAAVERNNK